MNSKVMDREDVKKLIYNRFIEPTKSKREVFIGVEIELPIINLKKNPVSFDLVHKLTKLFKDKFDFEVKSIDEDGNISTLENNLNGDIYTYDCSYNNIEFSFGKEKKIYNVYKRFKEYYLFIQEILNEENHILSGFGVNPYRNYNNLVPIPNGRYRMLYHHLSTYPKFSNQKEFHKLPEYGMFTSASQVQIDVDYNNLIETITAFSKLEPIKAILFSNSILYPENMDLICSRDMLWEKSMQGYNKKNVGMYDPIPKDINEFLEYMLDLSIYCCERGNKYINFTPTLISDYFNKKEIIGEYYNDGKYKKIKFKPELNDFKYFRTFKFEDITFRGTIEFRSVCCQPVEDSLTVPAFHLGLITKVKELNELLDNDTTIYNQGYSSSDLRELFIKADIPAWVNQENLKKLLKKVLDLASDGLKSRKNNEEEFLKPLYERAKILDNPAQKLIRNLNSDNTLEEMIVSYSKLPKDI
ncbi:glutamate--cysteine ligase family protein [Methanobrevibacter curvatus]|uniref:Glutamate--cysteine ligase n=1 Tax=Methanobrevibacter curvatus TaxID=49547 RepID=A0A166CMJ9_9EURY|nr:hypothetical protein [Methanobrevibacter curvatus]KZX14668.1 hypothetical protein MBCUR_04190 [Methanobrevibacter curvatus]